ncbi:MAG: nicotinamide riboside transporter PnuC [Bacteroidales bacterium]|nr:nicotinamide riboside transporter PnuC [Bacteroidales bacterium]
MIEWLVLNRIELIASVLGILYVLLALRQNILCWPVGIANVALYIFVFYDAGLFGDMALQAFYLVMGFYGWYAWKSNKSAESEKLKISKISLKTLIFIIILSAFCTYLFGYILSRTISTIPYWDGATTALGLAGTWLTARKYLENWLWWIFTDMLCVGIYIYKELHLTVIFYSVMTIMAAIAWFKWKKDYKKQIAG